MKAELIAALTLGGWTLAAAAQAAGPGYHIIDRIAGPDGGWDYVRVDSANNRVLVARGTSVMAVDLATKAATGGLAKGVGLHDAMPVNGGAEVMITNGTTNTAVFVNAKTFETVATVATGKGPDAAAFDTHSGLALVMDHDGGQVTLIDPKAHKVVGTVEVGGAIESAAVDGAGKAFVNVEDKNQIAVIDIAARKVVARYSLKGCDGPTGLAYDAADQQLIAACDGTTVLVDAKTGKTLANLPTGKGADGIVYDPGQKLAFVSAGGPGTVAVVSVGKGKAEIVEKPATAPGARTIGLDPKTGRIYVPSAQFGPAPAGGGRRPTIPGTFQLLVLDK